MVAPRRVEIEDLVVVYSGVMMTARRRMGAIFFRNMVLRGPTTMEERMAIIRKKLKDNAV